MKSKPSKRKIPTTTVMTPEELMLLEFDAYMKIVGKLKRLKGTPMRPLTMTPALMLSEEEMKLLSFDNYAKLANECRALKNNFLKGIQNDSKADSPDGNSSNSSSEPNSK